MNINVIRKRIKDLREAYPEALHYIRDTAKRFEDLNDKGAVWLTDYVLNYNDFRICSASSECHKHHYGDHGLIVHTAEVIKLVLDTQNSLPRSVSIHVSSFGLFLAALFHDVGKTHDYCINTATENVDETLKWTADPHKRHVHHVARSAIIWSKAIEECPFEEAKSMESAVLHAILAHHGRREWGSPVAPKTRIAWLLHLCDSISARMYDADTRTDHE